MSLLYHLAFTVRFTLMKCVGIVWDRGHHSTHERKSRRGEDGKSTYTQMASRSGNYKDREFESPGARALFFRGSQNCLYQNVSKRKTCSFKVSFHYAAPQCDFFSHSHLRLPRLGFALPEVFSLPRFAFLVSRPENSLPARVIITLMVTEVTLPQNILEKSRTRRGIV